MIKQSFHLSPEASSPLYNLISSPLVHFIFLVLSLVSVLLFSITVGYAARHIPTRTGWYDLSEDNHFYEELALAFSFLPFVWLAFLLLWHRVLKRPKIHPGYYIGFDLTIALALIGTYAMTTTLSPALFQRAADICGYPARGPDYDACKRHKAVLFGLAITAYVFGYIMVILLLIRFAIACRVCFVYDRSKADKRLLQRLSAQMGRPSRSTSLDNIIPPPGNGGYGPSREHVVLESRMV
ncbi:MAG: hypothetical protein Q9193_005293 [Seirophora villosa]